MTKVDHPSVFVVDSYATRPPIPPRGGQRKRGLGPAQTLLFLLVGLAFCGIAIEACFIYHFFQVESAVHASSSKMTGGEEAPPTLWPSYEIHPSKPVAHLTDGQDVVHKTRVMGWSMISGPLLYEVDYKDGHLIIQREGYYFVYSKVFFTESRVFHHAINRISEKYSRGNMTLLQARKYSRTNPLNKIRSNSFLGGVFQLDQNDALYVTVSNTKQITRHGAYENVFGAFMI
ncbi:tumor necrosis factor ligand superfamily member 14 [Echeneis naucrates]|uniref:Tumor necrosis factor ligand superfamily member 14-like n=1 Tax=Echeneis naucrates TaxID=173247 RepID=A0A665VN70_ECHNA|nr:tumor necrosis factor ligand superfamily member 14-like [Echeneis naucrates]